LLSLRRIATRALERGDRDSAGRLARELLALAEDYREDWYYGNALHYGHLLLGRVALARGDLAAAAAELLEAGRTPGSPQLNSFGPNMALARELLARGQTAPVREYFLLCRRFWMPEFGDAKLKEWDSDVVAGREPLRPESGLLRGVTTDRPPRSAEARRAFEASDALTRLVVLPNAHDLQARAALLEKALATGDQRSVRVEGESILELLARTYEITTPRLRVLGTRPRKVWEGGQFELFGDYDFQEKRIRIWMRTAVLEKVTSYRGLLHTLLHEFCHHLDREGLGFLETPHTRGFHGRVDDLYHLALATPPKSRRPLVWIRMGSAWRIDWLKLRTSRSGDR